jgi:hypothetical protein
VTFVDLVFTLNSTRFHDKATLLAVMGTARGAA